MEIPRGFLHVLWFQKFRKKLEQSDKPLCYALVHFHIIIIGMYQSEFVRITIVVWVFLEKRNNFRICLK